MSTALKIPVIERFPTIRVLVVGDIMLDHYIWGDATRISPEAPVPVVSVFRDSYAVGGAANVARNLKRLGVQVELLGSVGVDPAAVTLREILEEDGIPLDGRCSQEAVHTIQKTRVVVQKQQLCRVDRESVPSVYAMHTPAQEAMLLEKLSGVDAIIVSDYAKGVVDEALWNQIRRCTETTGTLLCLDPKPRRRLVLKSPGLMTPNRSEALELAGLEADLHGDFPAEEVCRAIWEKYHATNLVVTLGEAGMVLSREGKIVASMPTVAQEVFDVSGAGDTVIAVLAASLCAGAELEMAAHMANVAAGVVVGHVGTAPISLPELQQALKVPSSPLKS